MLRGFTQADTAGVRKSFPEGVKVSVKRLREVNLDKRWVKRRSARGISIRSDSDGKNRRDKTGEIGRPSTK